MEALETAAPAGSEAREIQSSGRTKRAKTFPLSPLPFSPEGAKKVLFVGADSELSATSDPEDAAVLAGGGAGRFAAAFEPGRPARARKWKAGAAVGRTAARATMAATAKLNLKRNAVMRLLFGSSTDVTARGASL